jgi:hypothetical protein
MARKIELTYSPRPQFAPFHERNQRWSCIVAHRRAGKTVACVNDLIPRALYNTRPNPRYGYIAPFYRQAKEIAWTYLKDFARPVISKIRESDLRVELINGAWITLYGSDNPDALRGIYFDGVILDEYGDMKPSLWGEVILPTLADRRGWSVFIGTPKGKNHFYEVYNRSHQEEGWFSLTLRADQTEILAADELAEMRAQMSDEQFRQEFLCDFTAAVSGTYYASLLEVVHPCEYDPNQTVNVAADLGYTDSTALWFWQERPDGIAVIDFEEADSQPLQYYFDLLRSKPYNYQTIWLPHDAMAKSLQTGRTTIEQFLSAQFPVRIAPNVALQHGIDAVRSVLPYTHFSPKCEHGIDALRSYRRQYDEIRRIYRDTPLHDWSSHPSDAFRYLSLVAQKRIVRATAPERPAIKPVEYKLDDLWAERERKIKRAGIRI